MKALILNQGEEGAAVSEICCEAGISLTTYFVLKKKYAGLLPDEMRRPKKIVADLALDREMLQDVIRRKLWDLVARANWFAGRAAIGRSRSDRLAGPLDSAARRFTTSPAAPIKLPSRNGSGRSARPGPDMAIAASTSFWSARAGE